MIGWSTSSWRRPANARRLSDSHLLERVLHLRDFLLERRGLAAQQCLALGHAGRILKQNVAAHQPDLPLGVRWRRPACNSEREDPRANDQSHCGLQT
jgi:hypothetical protein